MIHKYADRVEIPLSKTKLILLFIGSVLFVALGIYFFTTLADNQTRYLPAYIKAVGILAISFFGLTGIYGACKMFDNKMGLVIDKNGILDNSNAMSVGLIKWADIIGIETIEISSTKLLLIYIVNPEYYINKTKGFKKKLLEVNYKKYKTPLCITSNTLRCSFDELEKLLSGNLERFTAYHERK